MNDEILDPKPYVEIRELLGEASKERPTVSLAYGSRVITYC
jgi:hypothetical protein